MKIAKLTFLNFFSNSIKLISTLILNKLFVIYIGQSGYVIVGQLMNLISVSNSLAGSSLSNGVISYTSKYSKNLSQTKRLLGTALITMFSMTLITSLLIVFFSSSLSKFIFQGFEFSNIFLFVIFTLPFAVFNSFLLAILNGKKKYYLLVSQNIAFHFFYFIALFLVIKFTGLESVVKIIILSSVINLLITVLFIKQFYLKLFNNLKIIFDIKIFKKLLPYVFISGVSMMLTPIIHILIRTTLVNQYDVSESANWQGIVKISDVFLIFFSTTITMYLLPKFSSIRSSFLLRKEIYKSLIFFGVLAILFSIFIIFFRQHIIYLLFSSDFVGMNNLFFFQITGTIFRILAWITGTLLIAKAYLKSYFIFEILFSLILVFLSILLIGKWGAYGATIGFFLTYLCALLSILFFICYKKII